MKKLIILCMVCFLSIPMISYAQNKTAELKEAKKELNAKASKDAKKEAKKLSKKGWITSPGALPLEKQLDKSYLMHYETDENGDPEYIFGEAMSIGENYDAAKMQALELAKQNLAGQIQTEITALIDNTVANEQLAEEDAVSITKSIMASKNLISQSLGRTIPVTECYRIKPNKNNEVLVRIAYNNDAAKAVAKRVIQNELKDKSEDLHNKLDKVLGW